MPLPHLASSHRAIFAALLLVASFALAPARTATADPVAVLASVKGRVDVTPARGGEAVRATFGRPLERGDRLSVAAGGAATVFFDDGNVIELAEKSALTIGGKVGARPKLGPGAGLPGEVYAQVSRYATGGSRQTGLVALSNLRSGPDASPLLLEPRQTEVLDARPAFAWRAVEGATRYHVVVSGESGALWERDVEGTRLEYPADAAPLAPGADFLWEVQALSDKGALRREESAFRVATAEDASGVRANLTRIADSAGGAESPAAHFLAGTYLYGRGIYAEAARRFESLARLSPEAPAPHEALGNVYRAVGLMDQAAAEYQRALTLSQEH